MPGKDGESEQEAALGKNGAWDMADDLGKLAGEVQSGDTHHSEEDSWDTQLDMPGLWGSSDGGDGGERVSQQELEEQGEEVFFKGHS